MSRGCRQARKQDEYRRKTAARLGTTLATYLVSSQQSSCPLPRAGHLDSGEATHCRKTGETPNARDKFAAMLKERVAPALREMGFKGSGQHYHQPVPGHYALLGFQKMRFGTRHDVRFTINLLACAYDEWTALVESNPHYGPKPLLGAHYEEPVWSERVGFLMPEPHDHWWHVLDDTDTEALGDEVVAVLREYGVPALLAHLPVT
jgi:hypothetical protein